MSLSEHERQVLDQLERDLAPPTAGRRSPTRWPRPWALLARGYRGAALVLGIVLLGAGLVYPGAAGEALAVAGYVALVGALSEMVNALRRRIAARRRRTDRPTGS